MKKIILLFLMIGIFISCKKTDDVIPENPKTTKDLVVNSNFDWKTSKDITLNVIGMKGVNPYICNTLYVKSPNGVIYYKDQLVMMNDYTIIFNIPQTEKNVILVYGSKQKTIDLVGNNITFDYIIE